MAVEKKRDMKLRIIKTDEQHRRYLEEARRLAKGDPKPESATGARLELLAKLIDDYQRERTGNVGARKRRAVVAQDAIRTKCGAVRSSQIKPISYVKANAADLIRQLRQTREPLVITQNGEARAVLQDMASYNATQETLALLRIIALANRDIAAGRTISSDEAFRRLRARRGRARVATTSSGRRTRSSARR